MASWDRNFTVGTNAANWHARNDYWINGSDAANRVTNIGVAFYVWCDGGYSQTGLWVPRIRINHAEVAGSNVSRTINSGHGLVLMASWSSNIAHDANGYATVAVGNYCNAPVNELQANHFDWTLPRLALAPPITGQTADTIKQTSVRLGVEIGGYGNGTAAAMRIYYRLQGDVLWQQTADQGDAAGYNYWTVNGLKPGKTYEYFSRVWNNNGDTGDGGIQTFKTKPVPSSLPLIAAVGM